MLEWIRDAPPRRKYIRGLVRDSIPDEGKEADPLAGGVDAAAQALARV